MIRPYCRPEKSRSDHVLGGFTRPTSKVPDLFPAELNTPKAVGRGAVRLYNRAMPLMTIRTNVGIDEGAIAPLLTACSGKVASLLGKPEGYVMTLFDRVTGMTMGGTGDPACLVEVRSVGRLTPDQTRALSEAFCPLLSEHLGVPPNRIFLNFTDFPGAMWGFNGATFG